MDKMRLTGIRKEMKVFPRYGFKRPTDAFKASSAIGAELKISLSVSFLSSWLSSHLFSSLLG